MPPPWGPPPPGPPGGPFGFLCDGICRLISAWFVPVSEHYFSYMGMGGENITKIHTKLCRKLLGVCDLISNHSTDGLIGGCCLCVLLLLHSRELLWACVRWPRRPAYGPTTVLTKIERNEVMLGSL
ncbi:hypothetical protein SAY87_010549 [Trapa incisa]|uniref:Uncharacterized protein n=1 Tax=Trapa incisa TaxID=236973 RepID=A0AAN7GWJ3_9MYRT|nr:hypothetical protein SAY87_010549 [Trapa incisa]